MLLIIVLCIAIGIVIGWNWPQPPQAKELQDKVVGFFKGVIGK